MYRITLTMFSFAPAGLKHCDASFRGILRQLRLLQMNTIQSANYVLLSGYVSANTFKSNVVYVVHLLDIKPSCCSLDVISRLDIHYMTLHSKSSGAKRVSHKNKNPVFVGFCKQCISSGGVYVLMVFVFASITSSAIHFQFAYPVKAYLYANILTCIHVCIHARTIHSVCNTY